MLYSLMEEQISSTLSHKQELFPRESSIKQAKGNIAIKELFS